MAKLVIGLVGEKGSGKEVFTNFLAETLYPRVIERTRSSDILAQTCDLWSIPKTRANLQKLAIVIDEGLGQGTLSRAVSQKICKIGAEIVIFDGIRWQTDLQVLRGMPKNILVYITADLKTRYQRLREKSDKLGEKGMSFSQFMREEKEKTEIQIPQIATQADFKIVNNNSLAEFRKKVEDFTLRCLS